MDKIPLTVLIPVKNEAANLPRCLASVAWADEVILLDSASTDATPAIAAEHGARLVQFSYAPPWPKKKQWALDNLPTRHDWLLLLDADEVMPPNSAAILAPVVTAPAPPNLPSASGEASLSAPSSPARSHLPSPISNLGAAPAAPSGYWLNRRFFFLGEPLRYAYTPNWNLRLFRRGACHFERLTSAETHSGDNEIHEHLLCSGPTAKLGALVMDHYAFPTLEIFLEKHLRYAAWEASVELFPSAPASSEKLSPIVALRRLLKTLSRRLPFRPALRFLWVYFFERAFLDGPRGLLFARLHALYERLISLKKRELQLTAAKMRGRA